MVSGCSESEEMMKLREENELLRACLKALVCQKENIRKADYDPQMAEIKELIKNLEVTCTQQHQEVALLKCDFLQILKENKELRKEIAKLKSKGNMLESSVVLRKIDNTSEQSDITRDSSGSHTKSISEVEFNIDNLRSIPPFPFVNKN